MPTLIDPLLALAGAAPLAVRWGVGIRAILGAAWRAVGVGYDLDCALKRLGCKDRGVLVVGVSAVKRLLHINVHVLPKWMRHKIPKWLSDVRLDLLILDELGFVPLDKVEAELLFNLLADRYERCSTVVTSNLAFGEWVQVFGSEKLTTALLDRLAHHAHILTTKGKSYRSQRTETA